MQTNTTKAISGMATNQAIFSGTSTTLNQGLYPHSNTLIHPLLSSPNKAPEQFALWLLGASDLVPENSAPSAEQWDMIKKRLYAVIGTLAADRLMGNLE